MSKTDTGGPAYPVPGSEQGHIPDGTWNQTYEPPIEGMTLLDYFAGQEQSRPTKEMMEEIYYEMKSEGVFKNYWNKETSKESIAIATYCEMIARYRFQQAEAMIAEKRRREDEA